MYDHYTADPFDSGDESSVSREQILQEPRTVNEDKTAHENADTTPDKDYVLFVHGWRMQRWERIAFAQTAFKRLWHLGYKGRFGFFSWPTEYTTTDIPTIAINHTNYDDSEWKAYTSAKALHSLLTTLNQKYTVRVFAHSMGNVVTSEALRLESQVASPRKLAQVYVATQAAVAAQAYDADAPDVSHPKIPRWRSIPNYYSQYPILGIVGGEPYFNHISKAATTLVNFYNSEDYALGNWLLDQETKPDLATTTGSYEYNPSLKLFEKYQFANTGQGKQVATPLSLTTNAFEILSMAAPAYSRALGAQPGVGGPFSKQVDLHQACGFTENPTITAHSLRIRSASDNLIGQNCWKNSKWGNQSRIEQMQCALLYAKQV